VANKKVGILFGMENTFPPALVEKINSMNVPGIEAEFGKIGGRADEWKARVDLPPLVKRLAKAAGLRPEMLTARSLYA